MMTTRRTLLLAGTRAAVGSGSSSVRFGVRTPFATKDLHERAALLAGLGYDGIELGREYLDLPASEILGALRGTGIVVSAIVGSLGLLAADPGARREGIELTRKRLHLARELGAAALIEVPTFGPCKFPEHGPEDRLLAEALTSLAPDVKRTGVMLLLEPLTRKETHYMNTQAHGARVLEQVGEPGIRLLSDFYHMQLEEPDVGKTLATLGRHTGYVHLADGEPRTFPGSLPFDYRPGFRSLKRHRFSGWLTMEFRASKDVDVNEALALGLAYVKRQWADA